MDHPGFAPQRHLFRREKQHPVDHAQGVLGAAGAFVTRLDIVLQPDEDIAVADGFVMGGNQFGVEPGGRLEQFAQIGRRPLDAVIERVDNQPVAVLAGADQEMAGEIQPVRREPVGAGGMQIQNAERHRQALLAVDHAHQVGVLDIVIGEHVAVIAVLSQHHPVQRRNDAAAVYQRRADIVGKPLDMVAVTGQGDAGPVERSKRKRGIGEIDIAVGPGADIPENVFCFGARGHVCITMGSPAVF